MNRYILDTDAERILDESRRKCSAEVEALKARLMTRFAQTSDPVARLLIFEDEVRRTLETMDGLEAETMFSLAAESSSIQ